MRYRWVLPLAAILVLTGIWTGHPSRVSAQTEATDCLVEQEPNDAVEDPLVGLSGDICVAGTLPPSDQDLVIWESPGDGAASLWSIVLDGVDGVLTVAELWPISSPVGQLPLITEGSVAKLRIEPSGPSEATVPDVLLEPGRYLVGVTSTLPAGALLPVDLDYSFRFVQGRSLPPPEEALLESGGVERTGEFELGGDAAGGTGVVEWKVAGETAAALAYRLVLQGYPGAGLVLRLADADGRQLASAGQDALGRAVLDDLVLSAGARTITAGPPATESRPYVLTAHRVEGTGLDAEPNDDLVSSRLLGPDALVARGVIARADDEDVFHVVLDDATAAGSLDIRLVWPSDKSRQLCLLDAEGDSVVCRRSADDILLPTLQLAAGDHYLRVSGDAGPDEPYVLRLDRAAAAPEDFEHEPNDAPLSATAMSADNPLRGQAGPGDVDHFRVRVSGEPQLWRVDAEGEGLSALDWITPDGTLLGRAEVDSERTGAVLTDMYLTPGEHWLRLASDGPDYRIRLSGLGPPDPDAERESNDAPGRAERLLVGQPRHGRLPIVTDTDVYRFHTDATDHVVLTLEPTGGLGVRATFLDGVGLSRTFRVSAATPLSFDAVLPPGDYTVLLAADVPTEDGYVIRLNRADPFVLADDQEPNDVLLEARPVPIDGVVTGTADGSSDLDWYRLPESQTGRPVTVKTEGAVVSLALSDGSVEQPLSNDGGGGWSAPPRAADGPLFLRVGATGGYRLSLGEAALPPVDAPVASNYRLRAELASPEERIAAWWPAGQRITLSLRIANDGDADQPIRLAWATSDIGWSVKAAPELVTVPASGDLSFSADVLVPAMVPSEVPIRVTVAAMPVAAPAPSSQTAEAPSGGVVAATSHIDVEPSGETLPTRVESHWSVPAALLGGLDAASLALGAVPIPSLDAAGEERLHDGFAAPDWGLSWPVGSLPVTLTVDLAGNEPVPVAGVILHPRSADPTMGYGPRTFELALSLDGSSWDVVLDGELVRLAAEQSFVLPASVPARFAQLRVTSFFRMPPARIELGEWKVVAEPGWPGPGGPIDIAAPAAGGHVVRMTPQPASREDLTSILEPDLAPHSVTVEAGTGIAWTIGFMDDRAARITSIEWQDPLPSNPSQRLGRVIISRSLSSPLGPWQEVAGWRLSRAPDGSVAPFQLPEGLVARFLRFDATVPRKASAVELPGAMSVLEAVPADAQRSVLGQWGMGVRDGPLEMAAGAVVIPADDEADTDDSPELPRAHVPGATVHGQVHRGHDRDWFTLTVPEGHHSLTATLSGTPRVGAALVLTDAAGLVRPMDVGPGELPGTVAYHAPVEPGATYLLEVRQPPASVVATFDTSASVASYLADIEAGIRAFSMGVQPGQERLRILPFDEHPLLKDWSDDRFEIRDSVDRYVLSASSSGAERNLRRAASDLGGREGDRAILLVTDAASSSFDESAELWAQLDAIRPLIVAVEVGGAGEASAIERHHLNADWATSAGGFVRAASDGRDIGQAFEALATWLRRPAPYELSVTTSPDRAPEPAPGRITVVAPRLDGTRPAVMGEDVAVELVLDTSGSMLEPLDGQRRIDVARSVLNELVTRDVPPGVPVALRTFTAKPRSCQTRLAIRLQPLDPVEAARVISGLEVPRSARTPLAAAIAAVAGDLAGVTGPRVVVVVSDGKESCKGDPKAAVRALRAEGFDVTVNVVGLALDRASRKAMEALASAGGGTYFGARDPAALGGALRAAVSARITVLDGSGAEVAHGTIGGAPMAVPPGTYRVVARTQPEVIFEDVYVTPGADVELTLVLDR